MDMEITTETVSRLILGHLHIERNKSTYNEYLTSCQYFRKYLVPSSKRKQHIITRFRGRTLLEVLQEYAAVYNIVQEYLESVDYFRNNKTACLLEEVEYLLNLTGSTSEGNRSRSSTPFRFRSQSPLLQPNNNLSPIIETCNVESDVNTTALQDLPGNSREIIRTYVNTSNKDVSKSASKDTLLRNRIDERDKTRSSEQEKEIVNDRDSPINSANPTTKDCSLERIQQTILDHPEFQAKIADNINSIINASVHSANKESSVKATTKVATELDSTIKLILQKTEEDPLFEQLLEDIIGDATSISSQPNQTIEGMEYTPKKIASSDSSVSIKQRLRSSRKSVANNDTLDIEICSNDGLDKIDAVVAAGAVISINNTQNQIVSNETNELIASVRRMSYQNQNTTTKNSLSNAEVILYDGPIDTLFQQNMHTNVPQNMQCSTTASLLMLQPQNQGQALIANVDTSNSYNSSFITTVSNVPSNDVNRSQQPQQPIYMLADNGELIVPSQMIICTSDATSMVQQQQNTVAQLPQTIILPSVGPKYTNQPVQSSKSTLVDLFSTYKPTESPITNIPLIQFTKKHPAKRIKTILPMPTYKIDILPETEEHISTNSKIQVVSALNIAAASENTSDIGTCTENNTVLNINENVSLNFNISSTSGNYHMTPMVVTPDVPTKKSVTPKSGSHVRVLDFNLITPAKDIIEISTKQHKKETKNGGKSVKSLFATPSTTAAKKVTELKSWDTNLRELAIHSGVSDVAKTSDIVIENSSENIQHQPSEVPNVESVQQTPSKISSSTNSTKETLVESNVDKSVDLNNTVQVAESIEKALLLDKKNEAQLEQSVLPKKSPRKPQKHCSQIVKKILRLRKKSEPTEKVVEKNENSPNTVEAAGTLLSLRKPSLKENINQSEVNIVQTENRDQLLCSSTPNGQQSIPTPQSATKSRIKRKCNIDSSIKQEVTVTRVKEIKSLDILTESGIKLILSPSKLANKRSLVTESSTSAILDLTTTIMSMPTLETPIKLNPTNNPETPNICTSQILTTETPFTKMFNEQTEGVDISTIPTPKLPITITPNLNLISPFNIDQSGSYNRPTDYSTSSSYYQPSDSEQNKSLEKQIIEECKRLESGKKMSSHNQGLTQTDVLERLEEKEKQMEVKNNEAVAAVMKTMKTMKTNIGIGRKNLNLIPKVCNSPESSSDVDSSSSSSSTSLSDSDSDESVYEKTIIRSNLKELTIDKRKSRIVSPVASAEIISTKTNKTVELQKTCLDINSILSSTNFKSELKVVLPEITLTQREKVLKDIEAKRKRTIAKFKSKEIKKATAAPSKGVVTRSSRGRLIKSVVNTTTIEESKGKVKKEILPKDQYSSSKSVSAHFKDKPKDKPKAKPKAKLAKSTPNNRAAKCVARTTARRSPLKVSKSNKTTQLTHRLDPLDVVEAHLSEHSAASTPVTVSEEQLTIPVVKKQTQEESQSILNMILTSAKENDKELIYKAVKCDTKSRVNEIVKNRDNGNDGITKEKKSIDVVTVPESKVSPDLEAEKLVTVLKQWGIHLIPKSKTNEKSINENNHDKNVPKDMLPNSSLNTSDISKITTFDDKQYTENDIIQINYESTTPVIVKCYNLDVLNRKFTSRIFIEELNEDVDIPLSVCPFESIFDLPAEKSGTEITKVKILEEVIVVPKIVSNAVINDLNVQSKSDDLTISSKNTEECSELEQNIEVKAVSTSSEFPSSNTDEIPKSITEFQMIKDMHATLDTTNVATLKRDNDSLYDFALTSIGKTEKSPSTLSKKRPLNESAVDQSPKRPKIDHELLLQELNASDKKISSKSMLPLSNINVKSKSDDQLLARINVEEFLSVLHP